MTRSTPVVPRALRSRAALRLTLALGLVLSSLAPAVAAAQARSVVVTQLEGRNAAAARRVIADGLESRGLTVTMSEEAPADDASAGALAGTHQADATIGGRASHRNGQWRVNLWIRDASGGTQGTVERRVRGRSGVDRLVREIAEALELVPTSASGSGGPSPTTPSAVGSPANTAATRSADPEATSRAPVTPADAATSAPSGDADEHLIHATFLVGAGVRSRSIEILSPDGVDAAYRVEPYFELVGHASARVVDLVFVRATFGSSVALDSAREDPSLGPVETWFFRLAGDAGISYYIDDTVGLGVAFGGVWDRYELAFNELVPTTEYASLRPAFVSGFRLVGRALELDAEVGVRIPLTVGDLSSLYGVNHDVMGMDGAARLHGVIEPGFAWAIEVGFRAYWLRFARPDGDATGTDGGWHATAFAGWQL